MPRGSGQVSKPTEQKALAVLTELETIDAIDKALKLIPSEYRTQVFDKVVYKAPYPYYADKSTWSRWRMRFLYYVAERLGWL